MGNNSRPPDDSAGPDHPRALMQHSAKKAIAYDLIPSGAPMRRLYESDDMTAFIAAVLGKPVLYRRDCGFTDCDLVLMMDVLEHVDDDAGLVRHYVAKVLSGTHFLATVPAFRFLWSGHDVFLEHRRRYTLAEVEQTMRRAGLEVVRGAYYFGAVFPLAAAVRLATRRDPRPRSSLRKHGAFTNGLLSAACALELTWCTEVAGSLSTEATCMASARYPGR